MITLAEPLAAEPLRFTRRRDRCSACSARRCFARIVVHTPGPRTTLLACSAHVRTIEVAADALWPGIPRVHTLSSSRLHGERVVDLGGA